MSTQQLNLPVFPLNVFLLPEGIARLRIFEARYLKMVKLATKNQGFVICVNNPTAQSNSQSDGNVWGSWVDIINFDQGKDGVLEIDVKCKSLVNITDITTDADKLHFGNVTPFEHWPTAQAALSISELSASLSHVIKNNNMLSELYPDVQINNPNWVVARWLELLPIDHEAKNLFIDKHSFAQAKDLVQSIIDQ